MHNAKAVILTHTPEPERIVAASARISTTPGTATEIFEGTHRENIGKLVRNVVKLGHHSVAEHAVFTIGFEDVSVFFEQFLIEFRLAAYTVKSRRYVDYGNMGWVVPDLRFEDGADASVKDGLTETYNDHVKALFGAYSELVAMGIPKEDARFLLPYGFRSYIYCTMNARELMHFLHACLKGRGANYPEIRKVGEDLRKEAGKIFPDVFDALDDVMEGTETRDADLLARLGRPEEDERDERNVRLLAATPHADSVVVESALLASGFSLEAAKKRLLEDSALADDVMAILLKDRRSRELEQANFTFSIRNITLASLTHLVRHRIQSIVVPDFVRFGKSESVILPETVKKNPEARAIYENAVQENREVATLFEKSGVLAEDRVYLMVAGNGLDVVTTMNARQLHHFLRLRTCYRAQWEIREIATEMRDALVDVAPGCLVHPVRDAFREENAPKGG